MSDDALCTDSVFDHASKFQGRLLGSSLQSFVVCVGDTEPDSIAQAPFYDVVSGPLRLERRLKGIVRASSTYQDCQSMTRRSNLRSLLRPESPE